MKKWLLIVISFCALLAVLVWGERNKRKALEFQNTAFVEKPDTNNNSEQYLSRIASDSILLIKLSDSISVLNRLIENNNSSEKIKYVKVKTHEKNNNVSVWSSNKYNEFLANRYKDRLRK